MLKIALATLLSLSLSSCAYMKQKECSEHDWFSQGERAGANGQKSSDDAYLGQCLKAEAQIDMDKFKLGYAVGREKFCHPSQGFEAGQKGQLLNTQICNENEITNLQKQYQMGLNSYCTKTNGEYRGRMGETYKKVCPTSTEKYFLEGYLPGKKDFLLTSMNTAQVNIAKLNTEIAQLHSQNANLEGEKSSLESQHAGLVAQASAIPTSHFVTERNYNAATDNWDDQAVWKEDFSATSQKASLDSEASNLEIKIQSLQNEISDNALKMSQKYKEMSELQSNMSTWLNELQQLSL